MLEVLVVLAILGLTIALIRPSWQTTSSRQAFQNEVEHMVVTLEIAGQQAISQGRAVSGVISAQGYQFWRQKTPDLLLEQVISTTMASGNPLPTTLSTHPRWEALTTAALKPYRFALPMQMSPNEEVSLLFLPTGERLPVSFDMVQQDQIAHITLNPIGQITVHRETLSLSNVGYAQ